MKPINNFQNVKEAGGAIENLPAGGYVCTIMKCVEEKNRNNNGTHLTIQFDVAEGEYKDWFAKDWKNQTREDKFWHGVINQNIPDETSPKYDTQCGFFKRFTNAVEASNPGYHWDWNEAGLKGKKIGIMGLAFKADNDDIRESLSFKVKKLLEMKMAEVLVTDEFVPGTMPLAKFLKAAEGVILGVPHSAYRKLKIKKPFVDCWGAWRRKNENTRDRFRRIHLRLSRGGAFEGRP